MIKQITPDALAQCANVIRQAFSTVADEFGLSLENCPTNAAFMTKARLDTDLHKGNMMYGLYTDGALAGFVQLQKKSDARYELKNISVLPLYRHAGYGTMLLDHAAGCVRSLGGTRIDIGIIEENTVLKNWYLQYGFVHDGTTVLQHLPFTVGFMHLQLVSDHIKT